ncbi:MAG: (2Fe-2S)-binding protein [Nitrospira sp.]|nr:(2Fe-2S)-binding protein [Nitrospira sp.]MCP9442855.1 (2Fe-2S)-binding protein [Nitrospira sp.]
MYLCLCKGITESDVREAGRAGCATASQLKAKFGLTDKDCCGRCAKHIHEFVELAAGEVPATCHSPVDCL